MRWSSSPTTNTASPSIRAGPRLEPVRSLDDRGIARRPVVPVAGEQPDAGGVPADHHAKAVVLDLMQPSVAGRWAFGGTRQARLDETGEGSTQRRGHTASLWSDEVIERVRQPVLEGLTRARWRACWLGWPLAVLTSRAPAVAR